MQGVTNVVVDGNRQILFSLSKTKGDFIVTPFKGSGNGGQKRNKTMSACRISHPASGAVAECQEERSFVQNRKKAFQRLTVRPEFLAWHKLEVARRTGVLARIESEVDAEMKNVLIEKFVDGKWQKIE